MRALLPVSIILFCAAWSLVVAANIYHLRQVLQTLGG